MSITTVGQIDVKINTGEITKAVEELNRLAKVASTTQTSIDGLSKVSLSNLISQLGVVNKSFTDINNSASGAAGSVGKMANVSLGALGQQITIINNSFSQTNTAITQVNQTLNQTSTNLQSVNNSFVQVNSSVNNSRDRFDILGGTLGSLINIGIVSFFYDIAKSAYAAYQPIQSLEMAIRGLGGSGAAELGQMREVANKLGIEFSSMTKPMLQWTASLEGTKLEGEAGAQAFEKIVGAMKVMGASTEDVQGALRALTQMLSKSTVQAEELRGQLSERFPGAMKFAAEAMGLSMVDFAAAMKKGLIDSETFVVQFADVVDRKLGGSVIEAANTTQSELNRVKNAWSETSAHIGRMVDGMIGSVLRYLNAADKMDGVNAGLRQVDAFKDDGKSAQKNGVSQEELGRIRLAQFQASGGVVPNSVRLASEIDLLPNATDKNSRLASAITARMGDLDEKSKKLWGAIVSATADAGKYLTEQREALKARQEQAAGAADKGARARARSDAMATGDARKIAQATLESAQSNYDLYMRSKGADKDSAQGLKLYDELAKAQATIAKLNKQEAKAGTSAAKAADNARERDLDRAANITGQGTSDYAKLRERMLNLTDPDGIEGAIAREQRLFAQRRTAIKELKNLTDEEKNDRIAQLDRDEQGVVAQIRANDAIENQIKERKKIETDISRIIDDRRAKETRANLDIAKYSTQLAAINNLPVNGGKPFFEQLDTRSKYAKGRDAAKEKAENGYDGIEKSIRDNLTKSGEELKQLRARLTEVKDTAEKAGTIAARQPEIDEIERSIAAAKKEVEDLQKQLDRVTKDKSSAGSLAVKQYNADRNDARRLDKGIEKGAVNYLDTIKDKSERAADVTMQFGKSLEGVLMSNSWSEARNNAKGFFAGLLTSIREAVVQLLIVKPIIKSIMDMSSKNFDSGGGDFFGKLVNGVLGMFGINSGLPSGAGGSAVTTMSSGTPSIGAFAANGGVFAGGVKYFANGGVFDRATAFPMAGGQTAVIGESGAEAVIPLKRDAKGKLGVSGGGASSQVINHVQITVQGNADSDTIAEMEDRLTRRMVEVSKAQASAAIAKSNRPGGANYGR